MRLRHKEVCMDTICTMHTCHTNHHTACATRIIQSLKYDKEKSGEIDAMKDDGIKKTIMR